MAARGGEKGQAVGRWRMSALLRQLRCAAPELAPLRPPQRALSGQWMPALCVSWAWGEDRGSVGACNESTGIFMCFTLCAHSLHVYRHALAHMQAHMHTAQGHASKIPIVSLQATLACCIPVFLRCAPAYCFV